MALPELGPALPETRIIQSMAVPDKRR